MRGGCIGVRIALKSSSIDNTLVILSTLSTLINLCSGWWWYERTRSTLVVLASTYYWLVLVAGGSCGRNFGNRESRGREATRRARKKRCEPALRIRKNRFGVGRARGPADLEGWKAGSPFPPRFPPSLPPAPPAVRSMGIQGLLKGLNPILVPATAHYSVRCASPALKR